IDVQRAVRRRLRLAAAKRDLAIRHYVLEAIEGRLRVDLGDEDGGAGPDGEGRPGPGGPVGQPEGRSV
ncbi:MAG: hypothetical protein ACREJL_06130, partial [Candidatus Methylomirabilales bacterium]